MEISREDFCKSLPKIELHAHLNGSLSEEALVRLGSSNAEISEYQKNKFIPINQRTLEGCFKSFGVAHKATTSAKAVYLATESVINEYFHDNVIYLELRTTPRSEDGMDSENYVESVVKAVKENDKNILVKLILSINRQQDLELCKKQLELILKMKEKYPNIIKGIDLSGNPNHGNFNDLCELFKKARSHGLCSTIHCGEVINDSEIREILKFRPNRIGHAPFLHPSYGGCLENWQELQKLKIPTEFCLTSNIITGTTKFYEKHHIREWIEHGLPFSLNTDDKGVFHTSLSQEYEYAMKYFNFTIQDMWNISRNSIDQSFASEDEKILLKHKLDDWKNKIMKI